MKVSKRKQQGRTDGKHTGTRTKTICPICNDTYLHTFYGKEHGLKRKGLYCPDCDYCRQDKKVI